MGDCSLLQTSIMLALLVLALAATALAQTPTPCEGPPAFTARFRHMDRERKYYTEGKMYYDHEGRRTAEFEFADIAGDKDYYHLLFLHNENKAYMLDLKTRNCTVRDIDFYTRGACLRRPSTWRPAPSGSSTSHKSQ